MVRPTSIKRARQARERTTRNRAVKAQVKTAVRRFLKIADEDAGNAEPALRQAFSQLDRAAAKGVMHRNAAARRKSRLTARLAQRPEEPVPEPAPVKAKAPRKRKTGG